MGLVLLDVIVSIGGRVELDDKDVGESVLWLARSAMCRASVSPRRAAYLQPLNRHVLATLGVGNVRLASRCEDALVL
jgi:hypothetical protein